MQEKAKKLVAKYIRKNADGVGMFELSIIWWRKDRDNSWRAIVVSDLDDKMLYEVGYNSAKRSTRINVFTQVDTTAVLDG
jgi:hypothetical protein